MVNEEQFKIISGNINGLFIDDKRYTIDIKALGGCLYCEPTIYKSLETGEDKKYVWEVKPDLNNFQDMPEIIYNLIKNHYTIRDKPKIKKVKKIIIKDDGEEEEVEEIINERNRDFNNIIVNSEDEKLIYLLDPDRFIDTDKWINIGIIMKSLNFSYELYAKMSKEYFKDFDNNVCLNFWNSYKKRPKYDMNLLNFIARRDNPNEYENLNIVKKDKDIDIEKIEIQNRYLIYLENENFIAYAPEDVERYYRWKKLEYEIGRIDNHAYHLEHKRTQNSWFNNPFMKKNNELWEKLKIMEKQELIDYYKNQTYVKEKLK